MDVLHRLAGLSGNVKGVPVSMQEIYDSFGSRNVEYYTYNGTQTQPSPFLNFYNSNRASGYSYDYAGNLLSDGTNNYLYDAGESSLRDDSTPSSDWHRRGIFTPLTVLVSPGKALLTSFSCDMTQNGMLTANGLALGPRRTTSIRGANSWKK